MNRFFYVIIAAFILCYSPFVFAGEHGGQEHGGKELGGTTALKEPSDKDIRKAMKVHVKDEVKRNGSFQIMDDVTGNMRNLNLKKIHERVGKTGNYYYSCADFKDEDSGEIIDIDLDVEYIQGKLAVVAVRVHKVNGQERYTYDENDNRIPVNE